MKRLGLSTLLILALTLPVAASPNARDSDMLLTKDGTIYTVESRFNPYGQGGALFLTTQRGEDVSTIAVPSAVGDGSHTRPALAYDSESDTLFVFWQKAPSPVASELLFCAYHNGEWTAPTSIDKGAFQLRFNLRIGVTRKIEQIDGEGKHSIVPGLTVHATWWQETGSGEYARYAMLTIEKGIVTATVTRDLSEFVTGPADAAKDASDAGSDVLRHPALFETDKETIDVVFGDVPTKKLHRVTLKPVAEGRVRIPIGVKDTKINAPRNRLVAGGESSTRISAVGDSGGDIVFYTASETNVKYMTYENGTWSSVRSISLNDKVNADAAVNALRRLVAGQ